MITKFKLFEGIKWYSNGKWIKDETPVPEKQIENVFKVGDKVEGINLFYWDDGGRGDALSTRGGWNTTAHELDIISDINYCEDLDGYTGQLIKLDSCWPWFQITNFELKEDELFEGVKWYSNGKLTKDETWEDVPENKLNIGDEVKGIKPIFWDDDENGQINAKGKWKKSNNNPIGIIRYIEYCENKDGYTGQLIKVSGYWPWFQITDFEHDN